MNRIFILLLIVVVSVGTFSVTAQVPVEKRPTFLSTLKTGQPVSLKEVAGRYEISTLEGVAAVQGHKVTEIGPDYIVVQDIAGVTEAHIPIYSIKSIIKLKLPSR